MTANQPIRRQAASVWRIACTPRLRPSAAAEAMAAQAGRWLELQ
jgi:hypothetical protein